MLRVIKISETPVSDICPELDYSSSAVVMLYDWMGSAIPMSEEIECLNFKPIVNYCSNTRKTVVSSICLEGMSLRNDKKWCEISLLGSEKDFEVPSMYVEHSISPLEDIRQFGVNLIHTFALKENDEVVWYTDPDWLNVSDDS